MNKEEPYRDQAERLKRRIEKINEKIDESDSLPPREQIHRHKKKRIKWKVKYPVIRLLVLFFILLPIIVVSVISMNDKKSTTVKTTSKPVGYETITIEKSNNTSEKSKEIPKKQVQDEGENTQSGKISDSTTPIIKEQPKVTTNQPPVTSNSNQNSGKKNPSKSVETKTNTTQSVRSTNSNKVIFHTVQPKETLYSIAKKYFLSPATGMAIIKKVNLLPDEKIEVGEVLKIPLK